LSSRGEEVVEEYAVSVAGLRIPVKIVKDENGMKYVVQEPELTPEEKEIIAKVVEEVKVSDIKDFSPKALLELVRSAVAKHVKGRGRENPVLYYVVRDLFLYGPVTPLVADALHLEDVYRNSSDGPVWVRHRKWGSLPTNIRMDEEEAVRFIHKVIDRGGAAISAAQPARDVMVPEGRFAAILPGSVSSSAVFSFRLKPPAPLTIANLVDFGSMSPAVAAFLWWMVLEKRPIVIAGEIGAGKTTLANALLNLIPPTRRIIVVEETAETFIWHNNWIRLCPVRPGAVSGLTIAMTDLIKAALRHVSDYLMVGEVRGRGEVEAWLQALAIGMGGVTTIHAREAVLTRLRSLEVDPAFYRHISAVVYLDIDLETRRRFVRSIQLIRSVGGGRAGFVEMPLCSGSEESVDMIIRRCGGVRPEDEELVAAMAEFVAETAERKVDFKTFVKSVVRFYTERGIR